LKILFYRYLGGVRTLLAYKQALPRLDCLALPTPELTVIAKGRKDGTESLSLDTDGPRASPVLSVDSPSFSEGGESAASGRIRTETKESVHSHSNEDRDREDVTGDLYEDDETESVDSDEDRNFYDVRTVLRDGGSVPDEDRRIIHPLLVALYIRQGRIAVFALDCLLKLINDTTFFETDFRSLPSSGYTSILDLTTESVCDR